MFELLLCVYGKALPYWGELNFPELASANGQRMVTIGDDIYIYGGTTADGKLADFRKFNVPSNTMTTLSGAPARSGVMMEAVGTKIYIISGGDSGATGINNCYDTLTGTWSIMAPYSPYLNYGASLVIGGKIYVAGGWTNSNVNATNIFRYFDPETNTWTNLRTLPAARYAGNLFQLEPTSIYFTHGRVEAGGGATNTVWKYTIATNTWAALTAAPYVTAETRVAVINKVAYIFSGLGAGSYVPTMCSFDGTTWKTIALPTVAPSKRAAYGLTVYADRIYIYGGGQVTGTHTYLKDFWVFSPGDT